MQASQTSQGDEGKACPERIEARYVCVVLEGVEQHGRCPLDTQVLLEGKFVREDHTACIHAVGLGCSLQVRLGLARKFQEPERCVGVVD